MKPHILNRQKKLIIRTPSSIFETFSDPNSPTALFRVYSKIAFPNCSFYDCGTEVNFTQIEKTFINSKTFSYSYKYKFTNGEIFSIGEGSDILQIEIL
jgi:hypothetical protein